MHNTQAGPSRDLRNKYPEISSLAKEHNPVIITNNGRGDTVLIGIEDYANYEDYLHQNFIISELKRAEEKSPDPNTKWFTHEEFWDKIWSRRNKDVE